MKIKYNKPLHLTEEDYEMWKLIDAVEMLEGAL